MVDYNGVMVFDVENKKCLRAFENNHRVAHRALRSPESELHHYRQALDTLLCENCDWDLIDTIRSLVHGLFLLIPTHTHSTMYLCHNTAVG